MSRTIKITGILLGSVLLSLRSAPPGGLKDYYRDYFPVGVAITPYTLYTDEAALVLREFNSLTAENAMKWAPIHPGEYRYNWKDADSIASFARRHHLKLRGHTLCWHQQVPAWLFVDQNGDTVSKRVLLQRLKEHITTVVNRYKDVVYAWDVVNEAISDDDAGYLRASPWYRICGEAFIDSAFQWAHAADPDAILFYNDYNTEHPGKRKRIYQLLKRLKTQGIPVQGIGLQGHWSVSFPTRAALEQSINVFASLGLQVQITELDVSVYAGAQGGQLISGTKDSAASFTPSMEQQQLEQYKMIFEVLRQHKDQLTGVTFWNVSDRHSWLDRRGKKNYPLLFDQQLNRKKVYEAVVDF